MENLETLSIGKYHIRMVGDKSTYLAEKRASGWFLVDGCGYEERINVPMLEIVDASFAGDLPMMEKSHIYRNDYPISEFFPK